jgi:DnaJ-class molecular chaperone
MVEKSTECPVCYGTGSEPVMHPVRGGEKIRPMPPCPECGGMGQIVH